MRSGAQTLVMLATPLSGPLLRALSGGPKQQADLRRELGMPAQTTLRAQLKRLSDEGVVEKRRRDRFPGALQYELTAAGRDLLFVAETLERWLERAPEGPLELGGAAAKAAVRALAEGWSTTMLRALAAGPRSLTELDNVIGSLSYPSLERRLNAMRLAGQIEAAPGNGRGTPYTVTDWLRQGVAPLLAACRWERRHAPAETPPVTKLDVETIFLLAAALVSPPADFGGSCRLAVELHNDKGPALAGTLIAVNEGRVPSRTTQLEGDAAAWVSGGLPAWFTALIDGDPTNLELGGDCALARGTVECLHSALFDLAIFN